MNARRDMVVRVLKIDPSRAWLGDPLTAITLIASELTTFGFEKATRGPAPAPACTGRVVRGQRAAGRRVASTGSIATSIGSGRKGRCRVADTVTAR